MIGLRGPLKYPVGLRLSILQILCHASTHYPTPLNPVTAYLAFQSGTYSLLMIFFENRNTRIRREIWSKLTKKTPMASITMTPITPMISYWCLYC